MHRFLVCLAASLPVKVKGGGNAGQLPCSSGLFVVYAKPHVFGQPEELHRIPVAATYQGLKSRPGICAGLSGEQESLIALSQIIEYLALDWEIVPSVQQFPGSDGVLSVQYIVMAIPEAHFWLVCKEFIEFSGNFIDAVNVQFTLISSAGALQQCTVDRKYLEIIVVNLHSYILRYRKDEDNRNHLVIDEYAADVVRDIFTMKMCGMSQQTIANRLNEWGILSPLQYKKTIGVSLESSFQKSVRPKWSYNAVLRILKNEVYTGTVTQGKCTTPNYKIKKRVYKNESDWIRVENMHEPIISKSDFEIVQDLLLRDTRVSPGLAELFPLSGLVYCGDCGEPMVRKTVPSGDKRYVYYICSGNKKDKTKCSMHSISEKRLTDGVLGVVKTCIGRIIDLSDALEIIYASPKMKPDVKKYEARIQKLRDEVESCNIRKKNLYEDFKDGILSNEEYSMLRDQYRGQIAEIEKNIGSLEIERDSILSNSSRRQEWVEKIRTYGGTDSLDRELISFLIERIEVFDNDSIQVTYRFQKAIEEMERIVELYCEKTKEAV